MSEIEVKEAMKGIRKLEAYDFVPDDSALPFSVAPAFSASRSARAVLMASLSKKDCLFSSRFCCASNNSCLTMNIFTFLGTKNICTKSIVNIADKTIVETVKKGNKLSPIKSTKAQISIKKPNIAKSSKKVSDAPVFNLKLRLAVNDISRDVTKKTIKLPIYHHGDIFKYIESRKVNT